MRGHFLIEAAGKGQVGVFRNLTGALRLVKTSFGA